MFKAYLKLLIGFIIMLIEIPLGCYVGWNLMVWNCSDFMHDGFMWYMAKLIFDIHLGAAIILILNTIGLEIIKSADFS